MSKCLLSLLVGGVVLGASLTARANNCPQCGRQDTCCYQDVVTYRCKIVPDNKPIKKTVYECKQVPYCDHQLPKFGHGDCCPQCQTCPKYKHVLIKKDVVCGETCGTKCVVEQVVERVPTTCHRCRQVPCDGNPPAAPTAASSPGK